MRLPISRHAAIVAAAALTALAWATSPAGAGGGWTTATDVLVLGEVAQYGEQSPAPTDPAPSDRDRSSGGTTDVLAAAPLAARPTPAARRSPSPAAVRSTNPNKAKNGSIIGVGKPPAAALTTPPPAAVESTTVAAPTPAATP